MGGLGSRLVHRAPSPRLWRTGGWIGYQESLSVTIGYYRLLSVTYRLLKSDRTVTGARGAGVEKNNRGIRGIRENREERFRSFRSHAVVERCSEAFLQENFFEPRI